MADTDRKDNATGDAPAAGTAPPNPDVPSVSQRATRPRDRERIREQATANDATVPGGRYIVGNNVVDAEGKVLEVLEQ